MDLPAALLSPVKDMLRQQGDSGDLVAARLLGGGCINHAMQVETEKQVYLLKWNAAPLPGMFEAEARGLALLAKTRTVRVPSVYGFSDLTPDHPAFILLEWLEGSSSRQEQLGEQLAALHRQGQSADYGMDKNNYLGSTIQVNYWEPDWVRFFAEARLRPQMILAQKNQRLSSERGRRLERLIDHLESRLGGIPRIPSLIHGDLWIGNVIPGPGGLALIDPAVSYSDREAEIAYTELFGGFTDGFYRAYQSVWPLEPGYRERRDLYNLYHLLNHLNLFGESYGYQVDSVIHQYI